VYLFSFSNSSNILRFELFLRGRAKRIGLKPIRSAGPVSEQNANVKLRLERVDACSKTTRDGTGLMPAQSQIGASGVDPLPGSVTGET